MSILSCRTDPPALQLNGSYGVSEDEEVTFKCAPSAADPMSAAPALKAPVYSWLFAPLASEAPLAASGANQTLKWTENAIRPLRDGLYYCRATFNATDDRGVNKALVSTAFVRLIGAMCARCGLLELCPHGSNEVKGSSNFLLTSVNGSRCE